VELGKILNGFEVHFWIVIVLNEIYIFFKDFWKKKLNDVLGRKPIRHFKNVYTFYFLML